MSELYSIARLMTEARRLAAEYRRATGKTLAISGEIAVNDAIRLLGLEAAPAGAAGYDLVRRQDGAVERIQVKARVIFDSARGGQRLGQLKLEQAWDTMLLVLMDEDYEPFEIYAADRGAIEDVLADKPHNKRGQLSVAQFRIIGDLLWTREDGRAAREPWDNRR